MSSADIPSGLTFVENDYEHSAAIAATIHSDSVLMGEGDPEFLIPDIERIDKSAVVYDLPAKFEYAGTNKCRAYAIRVTAAVTSAKIVIVREQSVTIHNHTKSMIRFSFFHKDAEGNMHHLKVIDVQPNESGHYGGHAGL